RRAGGRVPRAARAAQGRRDPDRADCPVRADSDRTGRNRHHRGGRREPVERPLRLITTSPLDELARTLEALLVVASQPLSAEDLAVAADDDVERVEDALELLGERYAEGRCGIVLERVAGGFA